MRDKIPSSDRMGPVATEDAEALAIQMLGWLAGQPELMARFLALSGVEANAIRRAAAEPGFLAGVTGFVMAHEPTLMSFCTENAVRAELVAACHHKLAGPEGETWP